MAKGLFVVNFTIEEVEAIQAAAKVLVLEGKTTMQWGDSGSSAAKQFTMPVAQVLEECAHALPILDPKNYAPPRRVGRLKVNISM